MNPVAQYLYSVITAALLISILLPVVQGSKVPSASIRLIAGIFLIIVTLSPLVKLRVGSAFHYIEDIETDASQIIKQAQSDTNNAIIDVIKQRVEAYILDKASDYGATVMVDIKLQDDPPYLPAQVAIKGTVSPLAKKAISTAILEDLGIPEESQTWTLA